MKPLRLIVKFAKNILPADLFNQLKQYKNDYKTKKHYRKVRIRYKSIVRKLRKKEKIKVAFFLIHDSVWKYDGVYRLMEKDEHFEPVVVVCPYIIYGEDTMLNDMNKAYYSFKEKGYNVVKSLNEDTGEWLDVKNEIKPEIVFFTNPHILSKEEYLITNYLDVLTCYVPYAFVVIHLLEGHYNQQFQNLLWKAFYETDMHKQFAKKIALNKGTNVTVTGYPSVDNLIDINYKPVDVWKIKDRSIKRIIWAPHHTIDDDKSELSYSNFSLYHQFMFDIAEQYSDKLQIAFKPHPILKPKLYEHAEWGKEKTDSYYSRWENLKNGQLETGGYDDLFLTSDAMIHDSASFMAEYLYTKKPVAFTVRDADIKDRFNDFGKIVFNYLYHIHNQSEIIEFINSVVFEGHDILKPKRLSFLESTLLPPGSNTASENIFNEIKKELCK